MRGGLRTLCLNQTGVPWEKMLLLASVTPLLERLHFNRNNVAVLRPQEGGAALEVVLPRLHTLFVEENRIESWEALAPLATLPALHTLNLNGNAIAVVPPLERGFASLRVLLLRANPIAEWSSIDHLDALPQLAEARLSELPLLSDLSAAAARRLLIGRLGGLTVLNGGEIKGRSRDDAERFYLRQALQALPEGGLPDALLELLLLGLLLFQDKASFLQCRDSSKAIFISTTIGISGVLPALPLL